ncbi:hypothetical protein [Klebsiella quasipneumoniae]|uniref:hypothetical protein n=1 Tax=Klebsiella/Raoultella group TaxID=2890311 RepID=UPI00397875E9
MLAIRIVTDVEILDCTGQTQSTYEAVKAKPPKRAFESGQTNTRRNYVLDSILIAQNYATVATMTPQQIAAITAAKLEHEGHQLTPAEVREMVRIIEADTARRKRFGEMMRAPAYQWKKPPPRR